LLQTVNRAGRVLDLFGTEHPEWGVTAVASELGIAKSQAHALLVTLTGIGLLQRVRPGRYRLGWRIALLNSLLWDTSDVRPEVTRAMRALADRYGETVQLAAWGGDRAICIAACGGRRSGVSPPAPVGTGLPAHCTGVGKVLLASRPVEEIRDVLARDELEVMTDRTIVSPERLREELANVRRLGFAYEHEEHVPDSSCVAAPIANAHGEVLAALSMSAPSHRWRSRPGGPLRDEYTRTLVAAASHASKLVWHRSLVRHDGHVAGQATFGRAVDSSPDLRVVRNSRTSP
jgi:IclR family transcriptional regulator, KDG regulon repressor